MPDAGRLKPGRGDPELLYLFRREAVDPFGQARQKRLGVCPEGAEVEAFLPVGVRRPEVERLPQETARGADQPQAKLEQGNDVLQQPLVEGVAPGEEERLDRLHAAAVVAGVEAFTAELKLRRVGPALRNGRRQHLGRRRERRNWLAESGFVAAHRETLPPLQVVWH